LGSLVLRKPGLGWPYFCKFWALCYELFYSHNLWILVVSWSVCPCLSFPTLSNVCEHWQSLLEWSNLPAHHSKKSSWPHPQILDWAGKTFSPGTNTLLVTSLISYSSNKIYIEHWTQARFNSRTWCKNIWA
jgi:hypothetical protein